MRDLELTDDVARTVMIGGYGHKLHSATAGRFGCDGCFFCGVAPEAGVVVWHTCYGDIICSGCSERYRGR